VCQNLGDCHQVFNGFLNQHGHLGRKPSKVIHDSILCEGFFFELPYDLFGIFYAIMSQSITPSACFLLTSVQFKFSSNLLFWHSYKGGWKLEVRSCFVHSILPGNIDIFSPKIQDQYLQYLQFLSKIIQNLKINLYATKIGDKSSYSVIDHPIRYSACENWSGGTFYLFLVAALQKSPIFCNLSLH
jgi:hypothetical protein